MFNVHEHHLVFVFLVFCAVDEPEIASINAAVPPTLGETVSHGESSGFKA